MFGFSGENISKRMFTTQASDQKSR